VGSIYLILQNIASTVIGVLGYAFMARAITPKEMGVVAGVTLVHSLAQVLVDFGLNTSIAKFVSEDIGRKTDYSKHVFSAIVFRLLAASVVSLPVFFFSTTVSEAFFGTVEYSGLLNVVTVDIVLVSIASLLNGILLGSGRLKSMAVFNTASITTRWAFIAVFLLKGYGLTGVFYGWIAGSLVLLAMLVSSTLRLTGFRRGFAEEPGVLRGMLRFSLPLHVASIVSFLYTWYDKALILAFLPLQQLGVYNVAYTAFSVLASIASALGSSLLPYYGVMYGRGEHEAVSEGVRWASKYTMLIVFPLALGLASTSRHVLILFAGQQYEPGWPALATLSVFGLVYGFSPAFSNLLLIYGRTKTILVITLASTLLSIGFMPLVLVLNLAGLAVVRGMSILLSFLISLYFVSKIVRVRVDASVALKIFLSSMLMGVAVLVVQQFLQSSLFLPLHVLVGVATYVFLIRGMGILTGEDAKLIEEIFGERFSKYVVRIMGIGLS
jgi:stage V sporulation protein B